MSSINRLCITGNLTKDPQYKVIPSSQTALCEFGIAANRKWGDKEEVLFLDVSIFGKLADVANKYCRKGKPVALSGRLKQDVWEDKNGGGKRSKIILIADELQLLGGRDDDSDQQQDATPARQQRPPQRQQASAEPPFGDEKQFDDSQIPF